MGAGFARRRLPRGSAHPRASQPQPYLDEARLGRYRESYRYLSYLADERGHGANQERPGADRPDLVDAVLAADAEWLEGG